MAEPSRTATELLAALRERHLMIAVAESLTGGLVTSALVDVPGASLVLRGGVVAYATDLKGTLLDVDRDLLAARGAVDPDVAAAMARGVAQLLGADMGIATTGVAGPGSQDGHPAGTVHVATWGPSGAVVWSRSLPGDREAVRLAARDLALDLALEGARQLPGGREAHP